MNAVAYVRVSTEGQTTENQVADLTQLAQRRGWTLEFRHETESARKQRPVLEQLMKDARQGKVGAVLVWKLDRLERSLVKCVQRVLEFDTCGVQLVSFSEPWLDTAGPARGLLVSIFAWVAEEERRVLVERTHAGLRRAVASGKTLGRPGVSKVLLHAAADRVLHGDSIRKAALACGVPKSSLARFLDCGKSVPNRYPNNTPKIAMESGAEPPPKSST